VPRGTLAWARDLSSLAGLDFDRRTVYSVDATGVVHALDRDGGASLWRQAGLRLRGVGTPRVVAGVVAVGDREGFVHLLAPEDGSFVGRVATDGSAIAGLPAVFPGGLVVQTLAGGVYALGIGR
jgi:outer membrane protein assembly factor BamB